MTPAQNETIRKLVGTIIHRDFSRKGAHGAGLTGAAKALGLSQATLSDFMNGHRGGGVRLLLAVAAYEKVSVDQILSGMPFEVSQAPLKQDPQQRFHVHEDPYPLRVEVRKKPWYQEYPEPVRALFESIFFEGAELNDAYDWMKWLEKLNQRFKEWCEQGHEEEQFSFKSLKTRGRRSLP